MRKLFTTVPAYNPKPGSGDNTGYKKGINNSISEEEIPYLNESPSESVYPVNNKFLNAQIVFGRDRPAGIEGGLGGEGLTQVSRIDMVVGRKPYESGVSVNPNFSTDCARIYVCEKTKIDKYFGLVEGKSGTAPYRSAIGLKADAVRVIARESIKLVTGPFPNESSPSSMPPGSEIENVGTLGINLIAGNDDTDLQPIPKGDNLVEAFKEVASMISQLATSFSKFATEQGAFNAVIMNHSHALGVDGQPSGLPTPTGARIPIVVVPDATLAGAGINMMKTCTTTVKNCITLGNFTITNFDKDYLNPEEPISKIFGSKYINSAYNYTN